MPRDGTKNLKPVTERTKDEARAISSKGGKASGIARRKKADLKKAFEILLSLDVTDSKIKKQLEEMGMAGNNEALLAFATFQQAVKGNQKATENIIKLTNTKDKYDIQEQKERIKALKYENRERAEAEKGSSETIEIVDAWTEDVRGATDDL
ncbi:TPA: KGG domain-containing protein [Streptococcus pneumoniae]|uniref:KGG domain-containing protein n=1 Tax=Streptococcus pneumoniae TaxID=1313 RepID=UPI0009D9D5B1|nr:KGG domain-containing protein [Streptococcus pneumoniae]MBW5203155.1 stress-induced protein [Streptococcus pneumoniae]MDG8103225.1 stress-induced protein [Streptococcus pneumoniae]MDG8831929.1 stress-induced protein [Streptococcus pneumoniae]MDV8802182.1 stress-induced protein [Streptococcus pneumoniae]VQS60301.1 phage protein [Streptococcus pneumoniae]